tara:strand:+ start:504 stop:1097 length:594 start_codon:yes stop_codon:yes gene_type:complete
MPKNNRRQDILQALAIMLESSPGSRITTAALAAKVGVSEAALYRHFPSKAKMLEGLIEYIEESLFTRMSIIMAEEQTAHRRCRGVLWLLITFAERNPGLARLLAGDGLLGETERLHLRMRQIFDRIETQLRLILREWEITQLSAPKLPTSSMANLLLSIAEGRISQFVRSGFSKLPSERLDEQWSALSKVLFEDAKN